MTLMAPIQLQGSLLNSSAMHTPSQYKIDLARQIFEDELSQPVGVEQAVDFIRRSQQMIEWFTEVTSQDGFAWPADFDPRAYGIEEA